MGESGEDADEAEERRNVRGEEFKVVIRIETPADSILHNQNFWNFGDVKKIRPESMVENSKENSRLGKRYKIHKKLMKQNRVRPSQHYRPFFQVWSGK